MSRKHMLRASAAIVLLGSYAAPAMAQDGAAQTGDEGQETLVVTGTRAQPRSVIDSPVPIDVVGGDTLSRMGSAMPLRDQLSALIPSFQSTTQSSSSWDSLARAAGLRGLGGAHVLVLVNGKRRHNSSLMTLTTGTLSNGSNPVDLDLIPNGAIKQIEVLRDGAAAQYGSDAIAGVINIILKDDASGGDLSLSAGQRYEEGGSSDGETYTFDVTKGFKLGESGFLTLTASGRDQAATIRNQPATGNFYFPINGQPNPREATVDKSDVFQGGLPRNKSITTAANVGYDFGDFEAYGSATFAARSAQVGQSFRRPNSAQNLLQVYPDGFTPIYTLSERDYQMLGGLKGEAAEWKWDISSTFGRNLARHGSTNSLNASLGPSSPTRFRTFDSSFEQWTTNLDLSREIDLGLDAPLNLALGAEYRWEKFATTPRDPLAFTNGRYVFPADYGGLVGMSAVVGAQGAITLAPDDAADISRQSFAGYVDASIDLTSRWFVDLAGRFEHYDDSAGDVVSGKLSTRYEVSDWMAIRGTISNGFRAPSLSQQGFAQSSTQVFTINGANIPIDSKTVRVDSPVGTALGSTPLKPEKSVNYSVGMTLEPMAGLTLTVDGYRIELRDRIMLTSFLSGPAVNAILAQNGFPSYYVRYFTNAIDTNTTGVDVVAAYSQRMPGEWGMLRLTAAYNYNRTKIVGLAANPPELNGLGLTLFDRQAQGAVTRNFPRTKLVLGMDWQVSDFGVNLRSTRYGKFQFIQNNPATDQRYGADWVTDIDVSYKLTESTSIGIGANNVFNVLPDKTTIPNTIGLPDYATNSPFGTYGGYYYGRLTVKF